LPTAHLLPLGGGEQTVLFPLPSYIGGILTGKPIKNPEGDLYFPKDANLDRTKPRQGQ
jgi:hypothetical protein